MTVVKYFEDLENWDKERKSAREGETKMRRKEVIRKGKSSKKKTEKEEKAALQHSREIYQLSTVCSRSSDAIELAIRSMAMDALHRHPALKLGEHFFLIRSPVKVVRSRSLVQEVEHTFTTLLSMMAVAYKSSNDCEGRILKKFHEVLLSGNSQ
jgi:hypothetical protein